MYRLNICFELYFILDTCFYFYFFFEWCRHMICTKDMKQMPWCSWDDKYVWPHRRPLIPVIVFDTKRRILWISSNMNQTFSQLVQLQQTSTTTISIIPCINIYHLCHIHIIQTIQEFHEPFESRPCCIASICFLDYQDEPWSMNQWKNLCFKKGIPVNVAFRYQFPPQVDSEAKVVRRFEQRFEWWYLYSHALKKCLESLRYTFRRKSLSPKMFPESVKCNMSWQQWRHGVWTCAVSNSSKSAFDGTIPAITTSAWSNFARVTVEMLVFKFDCIALCCFPVFP